MHVAFHLLIHAAVPVWTDRTKTISSSWLWSMPEDGLESGCKKPTPGSHGNEGSIGTTSGDGNRHGIWRSVNSSASIPVNFILCPCQGPVQNEAKPARPPGVGCSISGLH